MRSSIEPSSLFQPVCSSPADLPLLKGSATAAGKDDIRAVFLYVDDVQYQGPLRELLREVDVAEVRNGIRAAWVPSGDPVAAEALFTTLYAELHRVARRELARHGWGAGLGATSLLHEAYLDLSERNGMQFPDRNRFMAYAARVMRGLIIDYVRNRQAQKRGGQFELTSISTDVAETVTNDRELRDVSDALDELAQTDALLAEVVDLKFFCGFSFSEIAEMKGVSERTVQRSWQKARTYLHRAVRSMPSSIYA
jgi:RNA polymerase sigma factor (TIGR02999 family)